MKVGFNVMTTYIDSLRADIQPSWRDDLMHHGVKGMRLGIRRTPEQLSIEGGEGGGGASDNEDDPRKTSNIPDDGRQVKSFDDLWYDSSNFVKVGKHKKDESGDAYVKVAGRFVRGKNPKKVARTADKILRRAAHQQNR